MRSGLVDYSLYFLFQRLTLLGLSAIQPVTDNGPVDTHPPDVRDDRLLGLLTGSRTCASVRVLFKEGLELELSFRTVLVHYVYLSV